MTSIRRLPRNNIINNVWSYRVALLIGLFFPRPLIHFFTRIFAIVWHSIDKNARTQVENNLSRVIGKNSTQLRKLSKELFINYGSYLGDWAKIIGMENSEIFSYFDEIDGVDIYKEECERGRGIIILSAHLGNWEMGGLVFSHSGIPFNIVTAKDEIKAIAQMRTKARLLHNIGTITIEEGPFFFIDIINALKRNEIVAMLVDRYEKENGILVDFFGERTYFPRGPVILAKATGASIIPAYTVLGPNNKYKSILGPPIKMEWSEDKDKDIFVNVSKIAHVFEQYIRLYPNQWFNFSAIWDK
jgi:KDO2-lipid IV(A) lauroyltransferase